jgi:hypothetical protein
MSNNVIAEMKSLSEVKGLAPDTQTTLSNLVICCQTFDAKDARCWKELNIFFTSLACAEYRARDENVSLSYVLSCILKALSTFYNATLTF